MSSQASVDQECIFKLGLTLQKTHPDLFDQILTLGLDEIIDLLNTLEGTSLNPGSTVTELQQVYKDMLKNYHKRKFNRARV